MKPKELVLYAMQDIEHVRRNTIIQIVIATLAFVLLCRVWPFGLVQSHTESPQQAYSSSNLIKGDAFTNADKKLQTVCFTQEHIYQIMLYLTCSEEYDLNEDYIMFRLYDDAFSCIFEETQSFGLLERRGGFLATPDMDVEMGRNYYYEVIVPEETIGSLFLPVVDRASLAQEENTILYVDGIYREDISLVADFDYTKGLTIFHIIGYDLLILMIAVFGYVGILWCLYTFEANLETVVYYGKRLITILMLFAAVGFVIYATIMNGFGGESADRVVYALASIVAVGWFWCLFWIPGSDKKKSRLSADRQISLMWRNYIQTFSFALLFYSLCQYVNAYSQYYHFTNTRWMLIFLGLALLMIYTERELCNYMSAIWLVISLVVSFIYCYGIQGEKEVYLAKLTAAVTIVWGLVVITILRQLKKDFWKTIHWPFFAVWLVFVVFMWMYRFDKTWVFVAVLPFLGLLFMNLNAAGKSRLLKNFTNGILLSFGLVMLFSLKHRPYHYWMRYRYNGLFHTVASTGMYLVVVAGAVLGKLYGKWAEGKKMLQSAKTELFLLSAVVCNILLSMSRTAMLTFGVNLFFVVILAAVSYRKKISRVLIELCTIAAVIVISFPLMYSIVRIVPAVVNDPIRYEIEPQDRNYMIYEGDNADSDKYMRIRRYMTLFFLRFQTEEGEAKTINVEETQPIDFLAYVGKESLPVYVPRVHGDDVVLEVDNDISNGRFGIYMDYINNLTWQGHEKMEPEGTTYGHAHNSYIQVAYDFGIVAGIFFLILCANTLWRAIVLAFRYGKFYGIYFVPVSLVVVFGFISLTEWAFHPCIPAGFSFLFMQMLLMQKPWSHKKNSEIDTHGEKLL